MRRIDAVSGVSRGLVIWRIAMQNKVVLITGASGGLGEYVVKAFLDAGAQVVGYRVPVQNWCIPILDR